MLIQLSSVSEKLFQSQLPASAVFFSVVVFFIWSLFPLIGFYLAKYFKAQGQASNIVLFVYGVGVGLIENSLYYFDLLTKEQTVISTVIVCILFFIGAYLMPKPNAVLASENS